MTSGKNGAVLAALVAVLAVGCMATFAPREPEQPIHLEGRPSLYLNIESEMIQLNNANQRVPLPWKPDYAGDVRDALAACRCYGEILSDPGPADLEARVSVRRLVHNKSALLNLATAMLIPAVEDRQLTIRVELTDRRTGQVATAEESREFRVWYQLFLLFVYPFKSPAAFEMNLLPQLVRGAMSAAILQLHDPSPSTRLS